MDIERLFSEFLANNGSFNLEDMPMTAGRSVYSNPLDVYRDARAGLSAAQADKESLDTRRRWFGNTTNRGMSLPLLTGWAVSDEAYDRNAQQQGMFSRQMRDTQDQMKHILARQVLGGQ